MTKIDSKIRIAEDEIHVWVVNICASELQCATLRSWLDQQEIERASRIPDMQKQQSFLVAHGVLRYLLARYLACDPISIELAIDRQGKPRLGFPEGVQFNMTRSGPWAAFAFSLNCAVGIDLEQVRALPQLPNIIRRVLCAEEAADLMLLPEGERERGFFCCWTRKEAYAKAIGLGLLTEFNKFCVAVHPDEPARMVHIGFDAAAAAAWALDALPMPAGYTGALAYPGSSRRLSISRVTDLGEFMRVPEAGRFEG
jgi:4'-phosphopantetheinyl transferase